MLRELTVEELQEVQSHARVRGLYKASTESFIESGKRGVQIDMDEGEFGGKNVDSVYQGFAGVIRTSFKDKVRLIRQEDNLYLVSLDIA